MVSQFNMMIALPLLASVLLALSPVKADEIDKLIWFYHGACFFDDDVQSANKRWATLLIGNLTGNHCDAGQTAWKVTSGPGGDGWITPGKDSNSFRVNRAWDDPVCLIMSETEEGCTHKTMNVNLSEHLLVPMKHLGRFAF